MNDRGPDLPVVSYADFGEQFFARAVTADRVVGAVNLLAGQPLDVGPLGVGPGRLVRITARGRIGEAAIEHQPGDAISYRVVLPVSLAFELDLSLEVHRFRARLAVPLVLTALAVEDLKVFVDVVPPHARDIAVDLQAEGLRATVLQKVVGVEEEVRRFVARYVSKELDKPYVRHARLIDVGAAVDHAWERLTPRGPSPTATHITDDLERAIGEERWQHDPEDAEGGGRGSRE